MTHGKPMLPIAVFRLIVLVAVLAAGVTAARAADNPRLAALRLIPWPKSVHVNGGEMSLTIDARIACADARLLPLGKILAEELARTMGLHLAAIQDAPRAGDVALSIDPKLKDEAYMLAVTDRAAVRGADYNAVAAGTVTLLQALEVRTGKVMLPRLAVSDQPGLKYCATMLDIARKPYSIATLQQCVEIARFYKIRFIHLHMSDENAWTFPSAKYPQLGKGNFAWAGGEAPKVYSLRELKDLVAFADARGVTFVPEIETPGHSGQLRGSLPDIFGYKTDDGKIESPGIINIASDDALTALDNLVGEFAEVFRSSPYIHIGCDEASVAGIEKYPAVKARMAKKHLNSAAEIFTDYVNRMTAIIKKRGKQTIVWQDAPTGPTTDKDLILMAWREGSGAAAGYAAGGFRVIEASGAQLPRGNPLLLGCSSLHWQYPEELSLPHMRYVAALRNEAAWDPTLERGLADFLRRQVMLDPLLDKLLAGVTFEMHGALDPLAFGKLDPMFTDKLTLTPEIPLSGGTVRYTLDESEPTIASPVLDKPLTLTASTMLKARWFSDGGEAPFFPFVRQYRRLTAVKHDALGAKVALTPGFVRGEPGNLTDGLMAAGDSFDDPGWIAWSSGGVKEITLQLKTPIAIRNVRGHFDAAGFGLVPPKSVEVAVSLDCTTFRSLGVAEQADGVKHRGWYSVELATPVTARYVRLRATPGGEWTYVDEVMVNGSLPAPNFMHAAVGKPVTVVTQPVNPAIGLASLTDGHIGHTPQYQCHGYLGFGEYKILDATIDMGRSIEIKSAGGHFVQQAFGGVYIPGKIEVLVSDDNKQFKLAGTVVPPRSKLDHVETVQVACKDVKARYVRFKVYGAAQWIFVDQLFVNPIGE